MERGTREGLSDQGEQIIKWGDFGDPETCGRRREALLVKKRGSKNLISINTVRTGRKEGHPSVKLEAASRAAHNTPKRAAGTAKRF